MRTEVNSCILINYSDGHVRFDVDQLLKVPLLQSVYAEVLRLRMHFYLIRMPDRTDMKIRDWIIPRQKVICISTTAAHMDPKTWNTEDNKYPADVFWGERFLRYPKDSSNPIFSMKDTEGSWIPYGGGPRQCPGRTFAKRQIMLTAALMVTLFDCELLDGDKMDEDLKSFSMGIAHPATKVPVRIRRRVK